MNALRTYSIKQLVVIEVILVVEWHRLGMVLFDIAFSNTFLEVFDKGVSYEVDV